MIKHSLIKLATAAFAVAGFLSSPRAEAAVLEFIPEDPIYTTPFSVIQTGSNIGTIAWSGSSAAVTNTQGVAPKSSGYGGLGNVIQSMGTERNNTSSPALTLPTGWNDADYVYLSAWFLRTTDVNSGGRVYLRSSSGGVIAGFGIADVSTTPYVPGGTAARGHFSIAGAGTSFYSNTVATENHWYETMLVIQRNPEDVTLTLGYLFVRDATAGDTEFTLIEDIAGVNLGQTTALNLNHVNHWRIDGFRANAQIGDLAIGTGIMIPEPSSVALMLGGALLAGGVFLRKTSLLRR